MPLAYCTADFMRFLYKVRINCPLSDIYGIRVGLKYAFSDTLQEGVLTYE